MLTTHLKSVSKRVVLTKELLMVLPNKEKLKGKNASTVKVKSRKELIELINRAKKGDVSAFNEIYNSYVTPIFRFVYFRVGKWDEAEDLTQVTFLKAWNAMPRFKERGNPFSSLLYAIARNVIVDYWRKKKEISLEEHEDALNQIEDEHQDPSLDAEAKESQARILKAIDELSEGQKEIIMLKFIEGLSNKEIAHLTEKSGEAIRALQYRGLRVLRSYFKRHRVS